MYGGQTCQYEAGGKTPMNFNSMYAVQTPAPDRSQNEFQGNSQWGLDQKSNYGGNGFDATANFQHTQTSLGGSGWGVDPLASEVKNEGIATGGEGGW